MFHVNLQGCIGHFFCQKYFSPGFGLCCHRNCSWDCRRPVKLLQGLDLKGVPKLLQRQCCFCFLWFGPGILESRKTFSVDTKSISQFFIFLQILKRYKFRCIWRSVVQGLPEDDWASHHWDDLVDGCLGDLIEWFYNLHGWRCHHDDHHHFF